MFTLGRAEKDLTGFTGSLRGQWNRTANLPFRMKGNEVASGEVHMEIRKIFFTGKVVRHWNKLSRVIASSLLESKWCLNNAFNHMV